MPGALKSVRTPRLQIGYEERGDPDAPPIVLAHGFPDDAREWDRVVEPLMANGYWTLAPYTRGYGATRFLDKNAPRSGQFAALAQDIIDFADALGLGRFTLVGHDWGARASYVVAALWPERLKGLVVCPTGYGTGRPEQQMSVAQVQAYWYQWFFCTDRGPAALESDRGAFCRALWKIWSPSWNFEEREFEATAESFDNPDFVPVVIHSYRYRWGHASPDPRYADLEAHMAGLPPISVPTTLLHGAEDGASLPESSENKEKHFSSVYKRIVVPGAGHFVPREKPEPVIEAILERAA